MAATALLLGVDGGGTGCRARLTDLDGQVWGEGAGGPANIRFGLKESFASVMRASEPTHLAAARTYNLPFSHTLITTDAHAACIGAHGGRNGGIIIVGTGSVGWGIVAGREHRVGGWGFPVSDEGSGAWIGCEAARLVLWAYDGRIPWTGLLKRILARFDGDPHAIVRWMGQAQPRDFGVLAPLVVEYSARDDAVACELMRGAAKHIDGMASRLAALGVTRLALSGGLAASMERWLSPQTRERLVTPEGDALSGALQLARLEAKAMAQSRLAAQNG